MNTKSGRFGLVNGLIGIAAGVVCASALGDNISGADKVLCASATVVLCVDSGACESMSPEELNVPQFINVDLKKRRLHSTEASGQNRSTKINKVTRDEGFIYLQGIEDGLPDQTDGGGWTISIGKDTGRMVGAGAGKQLGLILFGACTEN